MTLHRFNNPSATTNQLETPNHRPLNRSPLRHREGRLSAGILPFTALTLSLAISACSSPTSQSDPVATTHPQEVAHPTVVTVPQEAMEEVIVTGSRSSERRIRKQHSKLASKAGVVSQQDMGIAQNYRHPVAPPRFHPPIDPHVHPQPNTEKYPDAQENAVKQVASIPVSTFAVDVDTAAYANARRQLNSGVLPNSESVRVEEFINYFNYDYPQPRSTDTPFSITTEVGPSPWNSDRKLMLVGLQGYDIDRDNLPAANLVFLIDVSGSMNSPAKLGLLKSSMKMLTKGLRPQDSISIAVYAGAAGQVLAPTPGNQRHKIMQAIDSLHAGGSTNGGAGIKLAYSMAQQEFKKEGINRVILATDGDFNVGTTSTDALRRLIEKKRESGVSLTVLGFGTGNYNDALMQELAQKGNGNAAYIDSINEARKVLVDEVGSTLKTIAKDVKVQVEFNPQLVKEYRLIGYETRALKREDFNNDRIDAGEIGAGHSVTALYELTLTNAKQPAIDDLRYARAHNAQGDRRSANLSGELAHVKLRYKAPTGQTSKLVSRIVNSSELKTSVNSTSENFRFAAATSAFGQLLRQSSYTGDFKFEDALDLARNARGSDEFGYRGEFEQLLRTAAELAPLEQQVALPEPGDNAVVSVELKR